MTAVFCRTIFRDAIEDVVPCMMQGGGEGEGGGEGVRRRSQGRISVAIAGLCRPSPR